MLNRLKVWMCSLFCLVGASVASANEQVNGLWVSPAPSNGFAEETVWYTIANYKTGGDRYYMSTASGYVESDYTLKLSNTQRDNSDNGLWCVVADENGGYRFYNKGLGTGYVLSTANSSRGAMAAVASATACAFTFQISNNQAGVSGWFIKDGTSGNNYWNQNNGYLAHWNSSSALGDNNSTFIFEAVGDVPDVPEPEIFSSSADEAIYHGLRFRAGNVFISEGQSLGDLLITRNIFDTSWAFVGDAASFKLLSSGGRYVSVKNTAGIDGRVSDYCYTVASATQATDFTLITNADGTYEIARKGSLGTTFNPWGGMSSGRNIGFWNAGDNSNRLVLIDEAELVVSDYKVVTGGQRPADISPLSLWYDFPATTSGSGHPWMEYGLPLGNGQIGATLLGGVLTDEIVLNEKTLYNGSPTDYGEHGIYACLGKILVSDLSEMGSVKDDSKPISGYTRYLDIERGVAGVDFDNAEGHHYSRRYLVSAPHKVLAARYEGEGLHLRFSYEPDASINATSVTYSGASATFGGKLRTVDYSTEFRVAANGGTVTATPEGIVVEGATEVTLYMTVATNFDDATPSFVSGSRADVANRNGEILDAAVSAGWNEVHEKHVAQFSELMGRVSLQLGDAASTMTTKALVDNYATAANRNKADGLFLEQLYFQYGRYLEVSCNNLTVNVPANLQGIWNDDSNTTFWHCDIHADVNVQMNYWPAEITNLSEMHLPFLNNIITLSDDKYNYHTLARRYKSGVRGWMLPTENNIFGGTSQWMAFQIKTLAAWNCAHLWQHYRYTLDRDFLKRALPAMLRAAQFIKDISVKAANGTYYVADEYSPEHGPSGHSTAFAQQNTAEVVRSLIEGADLLGDESPISAADLQEMRDFYEVVDRGLHTETYGGKTCLREWADLTLNSQGDAAGHRHLSHLMALYPYGQVSAFTTDAEGKKLYQAAVNSLHVRNATDVTGWSGGWKVNLHARALEGDAARDVFALMLHHSSSYVIAMSGQGGCYYNLWDAHSPFQIDGNFGYTAGVAEMLLQSYDGQVHLLPALPSAWKSGKVSGLKAIGDFTVDQEWADGSFRSARIVNNQGQPLELTVGLLAADKMIAAQVNGEEVAVEEREGGIYVVPTRSAGDIIELSVAERPTAVSAPAVNPDAAANAYNLNGVKVDSTQKSGIYIVNGKKTAVK